MKGLLLVYSLLIVNITHASEWKNMKQYRARTNLDRLSESDWLKKDRKHNTQTWINANHYNINSTNGFTQYTKFAQKKDFYIWLDIEMRSRGHDVYWPGIAFIVTKRLRYLDIRFIQKTIIHDENFMFFIQECNNLILQHIYPNLTALYTSHTPLTGTAARKWDSVIIHKEQCIVLDTIYAKQPKPVLKKLNRMAQGKGIYRLAIPGRLRMRKDIRKCKNRCNYGLNTIRKYYDVKHRNKQSSCIH